MSRLLRPKNVVVLVIAVFVISGAYSLQKLLQAAAARNRVPLDRLWVVSQAEFEQQRLLNTLDHFVLSKGTVELDDLALRLDIFWSRFELMKAGRYAEALGEIEDFQATALWLIEWLEVLDPKIRSLGQNNRTAYSDIRSRLVEFGDVLHQVVVNAMLADEQEFLESSQRYERLYWELVGSFVGLLLSGGLFIFLLFSETRRSHRLAHQATLAEEAHRSMESRYRAIYDENPSMFLTVDRSGRLLSVNQYGAQQLGYDVRALIGRQLSSLHRENDSAEMEQQLATVFDHPGEVQRWEAHLTGRDGTGLRTRITSRAVQRGDGPAALLVCEDITEAHRLSEQLSFQASHDALTGLVNRREFEQRLHRVLKTSRRDDSQHALCYMDLDQFKVINDTCGHVAGDELLRQLGDILIKRVRARDTLARLGGDEFGVLMEHCSLEQAKRVATTLLRAIAEFRFLWEEKSFRVGASVGLVPVTAASGTAIDVLRAADTACYAAKDQGRNRVHLYHEEDETLAQRRGEMQWVAKINYALEENRFRLWYQRIVPVAKPANGVAHWELLLRMEDEGGEMIPPSAFLPAAERYNLAPKLDRWVVNHALEWLTDNQRSLPDAHLCAINLSGPSLGDQDLLDVVLEKFIDTGMSAEKICFEITETAAISNLRNATRFMGRLKELGCQFALDDFGSGLSSFGYLRTLPVDYLKIDGVFVKDIVEDPIDRAMVSSINEIGHVMGKKTIAEFVENEAVLERLSEIGVDYAQGYGIGRPHPIEDIVHPPASAKLA